MTREDWARIKDVVSAALLRPPLDRQRHLATACAGNAAVQQEAESLLRAVERAADLYEHQALRVTLGDADLRFDLPPALAAVPHTFSGTARYDVRRPIGEGGMGVVYEVVDRTRGQVVALKTLRRWTPADLYRLKREFRSLADIVDPHLVPLYELEVDARHCFVTMALVEGVPFVDYVRAGGDAAAMAGRARRCLAQLVAGVEALHRHGVRHGDLKPTNILVTADGHLRILDFGLAARLTTDGSGEHGLIGTPAYLSPEQCRGEPATTASDWYAVGATLYHALAGAPPFDGPMAEVLRLKVTNDATAVSLGASAGAADLEAICAGLLCRDPAARWQGAQVRRQLHAAAAPATQPTRAARLVGRAPQLARLEASWARVNAGEPATAYIHGPSGIGKTALLEHFLDRTAHDGRALVLNSRCHEHESMPYKGLDGVVDGLSRLLRGRLGAHLATLNRRDAAALARLFPVMDGIAGPSGAAGDDEAADPVALRRRAFAALRDLLSQVARRQPLVVAIDDFHWADAESAAALTTVFAGPDAPPLLLLVTFRGEEIEAKPFLRGLLDRLDPRTGVALALAPLTAPEAARLVDQLLDGSTPPAAVDRQAIARAGSGHPLLIEELTRAASDDALAGDATIDEMLARRLDRLPGDARVFLETLALCGRPIAAARVFEACGMAGDERPLVARLRAAHFLRGSERPGHVELYHDRLRETLAAAVDPAAACGIHDRMAALLLARGDDDAEALFDHCRAAGRLADAAVHAGVAAAKAASVLAFDRAAALYRHALDLDAGSGDAGGWAAGRAAALEHAGRPVDAAEAYLQAAASTRGEAQIEWQRKAAELLLIGGRIDQGLAASDAVLGAVGVRRAPGAGAALLSLAVRRWRLRWRGLEAASRPAAPLAAVDRLRIDACWSVSVGLAMVDPLRAAVFNTRQLRWALDSGDGLRAARALALEGGFGTIVRVAAGHHPPDELFRRAVALAEGDGEAYVTALVAAWSGISAFLSGRWAEATARCDQAATLFRDRCSGVTWELNLARGFHLYSLLYRGELRDAAARLPTLLAAAEERGNLYLEFELSTRLSILWLADDRPREAEQRADGALARWAQRGFQRPHYHHLLTLIQVRLYEGRPRDAWDLLARRDRELRQRQFRQVQHTRVEAANVRARCALARAAAGDEADAMRAVARAGARAIAAERLAWATPFATLIQAALASQEGNVPAASRLLTAAIDGFVAADMALYATAARWRLGGLLPDGSGAAWRGHAERWFAAQGVRDPKALTRVLAPGFPDDDT